jgi:predicted PurR-regulated permease PerM
MDSPRASIPTKEVTAVSRLLTLVGIVVVVAGLYFGRELLVPLALAVVFGFVLTPLVELVEKCRLGRAPSALLVLVMALAFSVAVGWGVTKQVIEVTARLPDYKSNLHNKIEALRAPASGGLGKATATVNDLSKELSAASESAGTSNLGKNGQKGKEPIPVQVSAPPRTSQEYLRDVVGPLTGVVETAGIAVIFTLFILMKREDLRNRLLRLAGGGQLNMMTQALDDASKRLSRYLLLQFLVNAGYGVLFGLGVYLVGIPHPLLWGVLACLLRFIPYIGSHVGAAFPMIMGLAVFPGWSQAALTFALFLFLEITIANVIEPWLYGAHVGVSSLAILIAAIFWGLLWGPVGLILSTPLTMCLILIGRYVPQLNFLEILLGDEPVLPPQEHFYQRLLALDEDEARNVAKKYLEKNSIENLYDSVLIPALSLAEKDRHMNALDETRANFIHQNTKELVEELYEVSLKPSGFGNTDSRAIPAAIPAPSGAMIVCIPARDEADEIVSTMVMQLLRQVGHNAEALPLGPVSAMLEQVEQSKAERICVSALPPFAAGQAKSLCKQLRHRFPKMKIVLGLWGFPGGVAKAQERVGLSCADIIGTSLAQIVSLVGERNRSTSSLGSGVAATETSGKVARINS